MELAISCGWLVMVVCLLMRAFRQRDALRAVTACEPPDPALAASVTVIIPARNEQASIARSLQGIC
jgi:hypothetical protein